jgi:hypothetical protein
VEEYRVRQAVGAAEMNLRRTVALFYSSKNLGENLRVVLDKHLCNEIVILNLAQVEEAQMSGNWNDSVVMVQVSFSKYFNQERFINDISPELTGIAALF